MSYNGRRLMPPPAKHPHLWQKMIALCGSILLLTGCVVGNSIAWLTDRDARQSPYSIGQVSCQIVQDEVSHSISVRNTSDDTAYLRVRLVGHQTNDAKQVIAGTVLPSDLPIQTEGWISVGPYFYCEAPVSSGETTPVLLRSYQNNPMQTVEVLAEAIQGTPSEAVTSAWGDVTITDNGTLAPAATR